MPIIGSSIVAVSDTPRTRGKRAGGASEGDHRGPIPADTGETLEALSECREKRVYPRGRGGNAAGAIGRNQSGGLSPRTRGKR